MSFYKYLSEHDRVVSSRPLEELINNTSASSGPSWVTSSNYPFNFVEFTSGSGLSEVHVFDTTFGFYSGSISSLSDSQKLQYSVYNQFAKLLLGHDVDNNIKQFKSTEVSSVTTDVNYLPYCFILNLARSQTKDRVSYGSLDIEVIVSGSGAGAKTVHIVDSSDVINNGADGHHYGVLQASSSHGVLASTVSTSSVGYVFYEAGVIILSPYLFAASGSSTSITGANVMSNTCGILNSTDAGYAADLAGKLNSGATTIVDYSEFLKNKINYVNYRNVTELNSTIYFCRAFNHEFNYSSNPTYINNGEIRVKNGDPEEPSRTYITTIGLYSDDNQLLAVAKLSEPILKTKDNELIARVRLDW